MAGSESLGSLSNGHLQMAAQHLNAAIGPVVTIDDLIHVLSRGTARGLTRPEALSAISWLFVETSPALIAECTVEANGTLASANRFYEELVLAHFPRVAQWELSMEDLL
jgi:hypothetical protein